MSWSPSIESNVGRFDEVADVQGVKVVKPLLVVGVRNGNDSASHSFAMSLSVGMGVGGEHLDASLLVVFT